MRPENLIVAVPPRVLIGSLGLVIVILALAVAAFTARTVA